MWNEFIIYNRMLGLLRGSGFWFSRYKVDHFSRNDYKTMCMLLKHKMPIYNEKVISNKDIKLLDYNNKMIGKYQAA